MLVPPVPVPLLDADDLRTLCLDAGFESDPVLLSHHWPGGGHRQAAQVWLGHDEEALHVLARLPDVSICSLATGPNQRMWMLGDTFEMFFQAVGQTASGDPIEAYVELHVTPNNHRLQLRFPSERAFREDCSEAAFHRYVLPDPMFESQAHIERGGWTVFAKIPGEFVAGRPGLLSGQRWRFSFCRYDYDEVPGEPSLSSSSAYKELDFHRLGDWGVLEFQ